MEIHQKKAGPDYHRLKTMVKRSIEQNLWMKNFEARNGNYETSAVVKNQGTKQREQRSLRDCWQCETNGQCSKGDNCSFRHDINKRAKSTQPNPSPRSSTRQNEKNASRTRSLGGKSPKSKNVSTAVQELPQRNLHHSVLWKMASSRVLVLQAESGCRLGEKCSYAHRQFDEQPSTRSKKNVDKSAVAMLKSTRQLGCVFQIQKSRRASCWQSRPKSFLQVILVSVTPMLQNSRIGLWKRQNGKSDVPAKQRGSWPKNL